MKKALSLILVIVMVCCLAACGQSAEDKIASYISEHSNELTQAMESSIEMSGMGCTVEVAAEGSGIVYTVKLSGIDNVTEAQKQMIQSSYNAMSSTFESALASMQTELPELTYYSVEVCEQDGDLLATIVAGNK